MGTGMDLCLWAGSINGLPGRWSIAYAFYIRISIDPQHVAHMVPRAYVVDEIEVRASLGTVLHWLLWSNPCVVPQRHTD